MSNVPPDPNARNSGQAIWSLVLGILSNTCLWIFGSIPAIILGILAIKKIDRSEGTLTGRGLAIAGIITGATGVILGLAPVGVVASLTVPVVTRVKQKADLTMEISEVRQLLLGCRSWAADHGGNFPPDLQSLVPDYIADEEVLRATPDPSGEARPYEYRPGFTEESDPDEIVILGPVSPMGRRAVGYVSGIVAGVSEERLPEP